jgi:hypothetical protein
MVWAADLRERDAEDSQNSSDSSDSEWLLAISNWLLAPNHMSALASMSATPICVFMAAVAAALSLET